jgi:MurNAc alpha-1-phosphate uridylyltransferase
MQHEHPNVPKALIEVAGAPFAHWQLTGLANQGITDIVYCVGHLGDLVRSYVGDGSRWGASVTYVEEREGLLGTGGALRLAVDEGV